MGPEIEARCAILYKRPVLKDLCQREGSAVLGAKKAISN